MTLRPVWRHFRTSSAASVRARRLIATWYYTIFPFPGSECCRFGGALIPGCRRCCGRVLFLALILIGFRCLGVQTRVPRMIFPAHAIERPFWFVYNLFLSDLMRMDEDGLHWERNPSCVFFLFGDCHIEPLRLGALRIETHFIKGFFFLPNRDLSTEHHRKSGGVNQIYVNSQFSVLGPPSTPISKFYPLVELGLHQIRLALDNLQSVNGDDDSGDSCKEQSDIRKIFRRKQTTEIAFRVFFGRADGIWLIPIWT
jgi:hypothetical protein